MSYMYKMLFIPATLLLVYVKLATSNSVHMHVSPGVEECTIDVNGCSVPGNLPFFYKTKFTPACNKHDVCYSCVSIQNKFPPSPVNLKEYGPPTCHCSSNIEGTRKICRDGRIPFLLFMHKITDDELPRSIVIISLLRKSLLFGSSLIESCMIRILYPPTSLIKSYLINPKGKLYGWSRNTCDHSFEKDMEYLCIHHYKRSLISSIITAVSKLIEEEEARCKASASFYYRAVEHFGAFYYIHDDPPKWCRQACISEYGSPYRQLRGFHNI